MSNHHLAASATTIVKVIAMLFVIASLAEVGLCHLYEDDDQIIAAPEGHALNAGHRRSKLTLLGGGPSSVLDPGAVHPNGEHRRSRLYIGKRPRTFQLDGLADNDDDDENGGPLEEMISRLQESRGRLKRASKASANEKEEELVKRKSTSGGSMLDEARMTSLDGTEEKTR